LIYNLYYIYLIILIIKTNQEFEFKSWSIPWKIKL